MRRSWDLQKTSGQIRFGSWGAGPGVLKDKEGLLRQTPDRFEANIKEIHARWGQQFKTLYLES